MKTQFNKMSTNTQAETKMKNIMNPRNHND